MSQQIRVVDYSQPNAGAEIAASLHDIGFAVIRNHGLDQALIDGNYQRWNDFFHHEDKFNYPFNPEKHDGYVGVDLSESAKGFEIPDIKEFFHYYPWGRCPEALRADTQKLYNQLSGLARDLLIAIEDNTPAAVRERFAMPLADMIKDAPRTLFRIIHYPPLTGKEPEGALRAQQHGDINMITLLPAATADGLQVKDKEGNWVDVPINKDWIIINTGDMLEEASGFYYPSTLHRVMNPVGEAAQQARLAMPLFLHPNDNIRLSDRYTTTEYLNERYRELGLA